jgi:hypothetical protein
MSKTYGIHDVQMRYNKETDEIEILLPGNSSDPTKIIRLPNGGGGGDGVGFPVANARQLYFQGDEILTDIHTTEDNPPGLQANVDLTIKVGAQTGLDALILVHADSEDLKACKVRLAVRGNTMIEAIQPTGAAAVKLAFFGHTGAERLAPIADVVDLATTIAALNTLLQYWRDRGDVLP